MQGGASLGTPPNSTLANAISYQNVRGADTSLIASRLLYFYLDVHAVQSGCMDHKKLPSRNLHVVILALKDTYLVLVVVLLMLMIMSMLMLVILLK